MSSMEPDGLRLCNLCGSNERLPRYERNGYHIVECTECGLCYVAEQALSREALDHYYGEEYYNGGMARAYADYVGLRKARHSHYRSLMPLIRAYLPNASDIRSLDVGCAAGFFLEVAGEIGWQAQGVEVSPHMSRYAREELGLSVLTGTIEEVKLAEGTFNLVTMFDVIEHLLDPYATLRRAHSLLTPGGLIVVATGDISGATAKVYGKRWELLAPPGHLYYFSRKTLYAMLVRAGFEPLGWESDGAFLINDGEGSNGGRVQAAVERLHRLRYVNAVLRRLKLGSIMTVYARKCGIN